MNKIIKNKVGKGIMSLFIVIVLLSSALASSIYYEKSIEEKSIATAISGKVE